MHALERINRLQMFETQTTQLYSNLLLAQDAIEYTPGGVEQERQNARALHIFQAIRIPHRAWMQPRCTVCKQGFHIL